MDDDAVVRALAEVLTPDQVGSSAATRFVYEGDAYPIDRNPPVATVFPASTDEVQRVVQWCLANEVPFTPRGAGTGLSGGAMPAKGGVVISTKRLTEILAIDVPNRRMHAQSGVANLKLSHAVAEQGLHFAPDPSSQSVSTLGGNIAENSGGPHTLKYGVTRPHILAVTMVDNAGEIREIGSGVTGAPCPDLLSMVVGSEGTLGIVTEAWIRLTPLPDSVRTVLVSFAEIRQATEAVAGIIAAGVIPAALEMMDRPILEAVQAAFGLDIPDGTQAMLLVECDGHPSAVEAEMGDVEAVCHDCHALEIRTAKDDAERDHLWKVRKKAVGAMGRLAPTIVTHDGVIPRSKLPEVLDYAYQIARDEGLGLANMFHAGDGNLHPCFYFDAREPGMVERVVRASEAIMRRCVELGGSVTGEHGVGVEKLDLMRLMFRPEDLAWQRDSKALFPQSELGNPCKIIPDQKGCVEHMRRWRGAAT